MKSLLLFCEQQQFYWMPTQKQISFTGLKAKFTKNFDTFSDMDPFVQFYFGPFFAKTETHRRGGKQPVWKDQIVFDYFDQNIVTVKAYDEDTTENQFIGSGTLQIISLKGESGDIQIKIYGDDKEFYGTVIGKFTIKNLNPFPLLFIKNIQCNFVKEHSLILDTKPFIQLSSGDAKIETKNKQDGKGKIISWDEVLRVRMLDNINICLLDKNNSNQIIFKHQSASRQFTSDGHKIFFVTDRNYESLGTLSFDYHTINFATSEDIQKSINYQKKYEKQMTLILLQNIKMDSFKQKKDVYFKFVVGCNELKSQLYENSPKNVLDINKRMYADKNCNKLWVLLYEKNMIRKDLVLAINSLSLYQLAEGLKELQLFNPQNKKQSLCKIALNLKVKQVFYQLIKLSSISIELQQSSDLIGQSEPYVVAKVGGWKDRTEVGDKNICLYNKSLQIKYSDQDQMEIGVWDEDVTKDQLIHTEIIKLTDLKQGNNSFEVVLSQTINDKKVKKGKLKFNYELQINKPPQVVKPQKQVVEIPTEPVKVEKIEQKAQTLQIKPEPKVEPKVEQKLKSKNQNKLQLNMQMINLPTKKNVDNPEKNEVIQKGQQAVYEQRVQVNRNRIKTDNDSSIYAQSIKRSQKYRDMRTLPSIFEKKRYGDSIYDIQSSSTLQKSIPAYSVPKEPRWNRKLKKSQGDCTYTLQSSFDSDRIKRVGAGIGFGSKKQFPDWLQKNMIQLPAPGAYELRKPYDNSKGPTFGISHKYYEKVLVPKQITRKINLRYRLSPIKKRW